jgi:hypothetical protein
MRALQRQLSRNDPFGFAGQYCHPDDGQGRAAQFLEPAADVRRGSFPDLGGRSRDVWFTPINGHRQRDR